LSSEEVAFSFMVIKEQINKNSRFNSFWNCQ